MYNLKLSLLQLLCLERKGNYIQFNYEVAILPYVIVMLYCQCSVQDQAAEECWEFLECWELSAVLEGRIYSCFHQIIYRRLCDCQWFPRMRTAQRFQWKFHATLVSFAAVFRVVTQRCVTTLITATEETNVKPEENGDFTLKTHQIFLSNLRRKNLKKRNVVFEETRSINHFGGAGLAQWRSDESARLTPMCPVSGVICWSRLLLVIYSAPKGFSPGTPVFPSPQKPTFLNSNSIWILVKLFIMNPWLGWLRKHSLRIFTIFPSQENGMIIVTISF